MRKIIHAVKGWINSGSAKARNSAIVYIYAPGKEGANGDINPNDQIAILRRLSTFTSKENIPVTIVFPGRPSRKIPDGSKQGDVQARYATSDQLRKVVTSAVSEGRKNHSVVIATNQPEVEKFARSERLRHIRATTFEKALDAVAGPLRRDQPQQPRRQPQPQPQQQPPDSQLTNPQPETEEIAAAEPEVSEAPDAPPPQPVPTSERKQEAGSRKLHRFDPTAKKEERDQAILDLIDPL